MATTLPKLVIQQNVQLLTPPNSLGLYFPSVNRYNKLALAIMKKCKNGCHITETHPLYSKISNYRPDPKVWVSAFPHYLEAYTNNKYTWHKNNTAHLYFTSGRANLCWTFSSYIRMALIFTDFLIANVRIVWCSFSVYQSKVNDRVIKVMLMLCRTSGNG